MKLISRKTTIVILRGMRRYFMWKINFFKIMRGYRLRRKIVWSFFKTCRREKCYIFGIKLDISIEIKHTKLRASTYVTEKFQVCIFQRNWKKNCQLIASRSGRAGLGLFITDDGSKHENKLLVCSVDSMLKSLIREICCGCEIPYVTAEGCSRPRAGSALLTMIWLFRHILLCRILETSSSSLSNWRCTWWVVWVY